MFDRLRGDPIYQPLRILLDALINSASMPDPATLNALRDQLSLSPASLGGAPIHFEQATQVLAATEYESRIFNTGSVATRRDNWHDLFNALVWLRFGKLKAAINALHCTSVAVTQRSRQRDFATLLDESGVLVACDDRAYVELLRRHQWHTLFWARRDDIARHMRFFVVGHALYEKALSPYPAITGKALALEVPTVFMNLEYGAAVAQVDDLAASCLECDALSSSTKNLLALPILGIPGWSTLQSEAFYNDVRYFRP